MVEEELGRHARAPRDPRGSRIGDPQDLRDAAAAAVEDVLDAAIVAWTARRVALGTAARTPDPPELLADEWPASIWE